MQQHPFQHHSDCHNTDTGSVVLANLVEEDAPCTGRSAICRREKRSADFHHCRAGNESGSRVP